MQQFFYLNTMLTPKLLTLLYWVLLLAVLGGIFMMTFGSAITGWAISLGGMMAARNSASL